MFYYLYKITNNVNGKIYIGVHKTTNLNDGYMGSGKIICQAIQKYGLVNFTKVILEFFDNSELMYAREKEIVTDDFLVREDVYNLRRGGNGGFDFINKNSTSEDKSDAAKSMVSKYGHQHMSNIAGLGGNHSKNNCLGFHSFEKYSYAERVENLKTATSVAASESSKVKRRETNIIRGNGIGDKNSQFGTCWINHPNFGSRKCKKDEIETFIALGWNSGRKMRK